MSKGDTGAEFIEALNQVSKEKGIDKEVIFEAIETSLVSACKKNFGTSQNIKVVIDRETGNVSVLAQKEVVEEADLTDPTLQISLENAKAISPFYTIGDICDVVVTPKDFGRISAQTAKQVVVQKFREAERTLLYNEFISKERDIVTGIVQRKERKNVIIALGKSDAVLLPSEQVAGEEYEFGRRIKVYIFEVKQTTKGPVINVSRSHPELVKRLFEQEVPEVREGLVEIKSIAREAGSRTKIAVYSKNPSIDPVGACVGQNGMRVNVIVNELNGEKIDIVTWSDDPRKYISSALSPSKVIAVIENEKAQSAKVIVPDNQLSLAIGREGQNARLAAKLTGYRIDIKSESQARDSDLYNLKELLSQKNIFGINSEAGEEGGVAFSEEAYDDFYNNKNGAYEDDDEYYEEDGDYEEYNEGYDEEQYDDYETDEGASE